MIAGPNLGYAPVEPTLALYTITVVFGNACSEWLSFLRRR